MATEKLIDIAPGSGLDSGVFPTASATAGPIWRAAQNAWFRPLSIAHTLGREDQVNIIAREPNAMAQAYADGETRLYYEDSGFIYKWNGSVSVLIDEFSNEGSYDLEPFGTWLLATDNVNNLKLWKNDDMGFLDIGASQFARAKIIKKLAQRAVVYCTDVLPAGMHYSKPSDVEEWDEVDGSTITGAGNLPFRNLDSDIICVADLSGSHAVYTEDKMLVVEYLGETLRFGAPRQPIAGIGAVSNESVISRGSKNYGLFSGGVFVTDGSQFKILDDPALSDWLQQMVDWSRGEEVSGYWDRILKCLVWSVPTAGGRQGITLDLEGRFSFIDSDFRSSLEQEIFDASFIAKSDAIYKASLPGTVLGTFELGTHLLDGGTKIRYKAWDYALFEGSSLTGQVRFGYTDAPNFDNVTWTAWEALSSHVPLVPRESVYLAIEFSSTETINLCGIKVFGGFAGLVL